MNIVFVAFAVALISAANAGHEVCSEKSAYNGICRNVIHGLFLTDMEVTRYTYYPDTDRCMSFAYTGCGSNGNNFFTMAECEGSCLRRSITDKCQQPTKVKGSCSSKYSRFSYNQKTGDCEHFLYGGCGGNDNRFLTAQECYSQCVHPCSEKSAEPGPCDDPAEATEKYTYDSRVQGCVRFQYGGCLGNSNRFATLAECTKSCMSPCLQTYGDNGPCDGKKVKYSFDPQTRKCHQFIWGGCGGSKNRFDTKEQCENNCRSPCNQEHSVSGSCKGQEIRYSYDALNEKCVEFRYGGCGGTKNNFLTITSCANHCIKA